MDDYNVFIKPLRGSAWLPAGHRPKGAAPFPPDAPLGHGDLVVARSAVEKRDDVEDLFVFDGNSSALVGVPTPPRLPYVSGVWGWRERWEGFGANFADMAEVMARLPRDGRRLAGAVADMALRFYPGDVDRDAASALRTVASWARGSATTARMVDVTRPMSQRHWSPAGEASACALLLADGDPGGAVRRAMKVEILVHGAWSTALEGRGGVDRLIDPVAVAREHAPLSAVACALLGLRDSAPRRPRAAARTSRRP